MLPVLQTLGGSGLTFWAVTTIIGALSTLVAWLVKRHYTVAVPVYHRVFGHDADVTNTGFLSSTERRFDSLSEQISELEKRQRRLRRGVDELERNQDRIARRVRNVDSGKMKTTRLDRIEFDDDTEDAPDSDDDDDPG